MESSRLYGKEPIDVVLLHGGPGAAGTMAPVAKKLSSKTGVLEILNQGRSIEEQVYEIYEEILRYCDLPVILAGHSWGAWLGWIFTAKYANLVSKLILISAGPFEAKYTSEILATRLNRLEDHEKARFHYLAKQISDVKNEDANDAFMELGKMMMKSDQYNSMPFPNDDMLSYDVFSKVWPEADKMRKSGKLLALAEKISIPVKSIHGNYDPHPFKGVFEPLRKNLSDFKMHIIDKCGHYPWLEVEAQDSFYDKLFAEIQL
jgi:pimeloyl-ACP methyl ester carboxylesterase